MVLSARTIPGHERSVNRMVDHLVRRGARVLRESDPPVHVSGHAHGDEIAEWLRLASPRAVMPVHGDRRMLAAAADIAVAVGIPADGVHLLDNGDRLTLTDGPARRAAGRRLRNRLPRRPARDRGRRGRARAPAAGGGGRRGGSGSRREIDVVSRGVAAPEERPRRRGVARDARGARPRLARGARGSRMAARRDRDRGQAGVSPRAGAAARHRSGGRLSPAA